MASTFAESGGLKRRLRDLIQFHQTLVELETAYSKELRHRSLGHTREELSKLKPRLEADISTLIGCNLNPKTCSQENAEKLIAMWAERLNDIYQVLTYDTLYSSDAEKVACDDRPANSLLINLDEIGQALFSDTTALRANANRAWKRLELTGKTDSLPKDLRGKHAPIEDPCSIYTNLLTKKETENFTMKQIESAQGQLNPRIRISKETFETVNKTLEAVKKDLRKELEKIRDPYKAFHTVVAQLTKVYLHNYQRDSTDPLRMLKGEGGNCVAQTNLIAAVINDLELKLPANLEFKVQQFKDHQRYVLHDKVKNTVYDPLISPGLMSTLSGKGRAPLYRSGYLQQEFLDAFKKKLPPECKVPSATHTKEDFLSVAGDPQIVFSDGPIPETVFIQASSFQESTQVFPPDQKILSSVTGPNALVSKCLQKIGYSEYNKKICAVVYDCEDCISDIVANKDYIPQVMAEFLTVHQTPLSERPKIWARIFYNIDKDLPDFTRASYPPKFQEALKKLFDYRDGYRKSRPGHCLEIMRSEAKRLGSSLSISIKRLCGEERINKYFAENYVSSSQVREPSPAIEAGGFPTPYYDEMLTQKRSGVRLEITRKTKSQIQEALSQFSRTEILSFELYDGMSAEQKSKLMRELIEKDSALQVYCKSGGKKTVSELQKHMTQSELRECGNLKKRNPNF